MLVQDIFKDHDRLEGGNRQSEFSAVPEWIKGEGKYIDGYIKQEKKNSSKSSLFEKSLIFKWNVNSITIQDVHDVVETP